MQKLFRIHTERKDPEWVLGQVAMFFDGFTVLEGTGYWKGQSEPTMVIEIIAPQDRWIDVELVAKRIREGNKQDAVLVTDQDVAVELIGDES